MPRNFRTSESYQAEKITRAILASFLVERGFTGGSRLLKYSKNGIWEISDECCRWLKVQNSSK
jgi:hypothetical protein